MAYQAKRKKLYTEDFELAEEDGKVIHTLHVRLDPDSVARNLSEKFLNLQKVQRNLQDSNVKENPEEALKAAGIAMVEILELIFGKEDAQTIIEFYSGRYFEMAVEVLPFIYGVVPTIREMAQENRKDMASKYNRKMRRTHRFFGGA